MKGLPILLLGITIWSTSLFWPDVNLLLTPTMMLAMLAGLTALLSLFVVIGHLGQHRRLERCGEPQCRNAPDCTTRPAALTLSPR